MMNPVLFNLTNDKIKPLPTINGNVLKPNFQKINRDELLTPPSPDLVWQEIQDQTAEDSALAILVVDGFQPPALTVSNNNSVCRVLQSSPRHAPLCEPFCGKAFDNVQKAGKAISYRCHAGLHCTAVPLENNEIRPLVAIVGRAFTQTVDYKNAVERVENGDWRDLPLKEFEHNPLFALSADELIDLSARMQNLTEHESDALLTFVATTEPNPLAAAQNSIIKIAAPHVVEQKIKPAPLNKFDAAPEAENGFENKAAVVPPVPAVKSNGDFVAWQVFTDAILDKSFKDACAATLRFLAARYKLSSLAWLERSHDSLRPFLVAQNLRGVLTRFSLPANDVRMSAAVKNNCSFFVSEPHGIELFPLAVGDDVRAVIVVGDEINSEGRRARIAEFCRQIAVSLEVLRLREELARRAEIVNAVQLFNELLTNDENNLNSTALFDSLIQTCAGLLGAERGSLLIFDETDKQLKVAAAVGRFANELKAMRIADGERFARRVWSEGKPIVIENIEVVPMTPAPIERKYRSKSFVSFPLTVGNRRVGVLNLTDKTDGTSFNQSNVEMLEAIAPQMLIALDRAHLQQKAGKYEQLSITDGLTGLLNRRYLNERLAEEVRRSQRDGSPMSFVMIDIDNFKTYNDRFGHQAGDAVLQQTASCLRDVLRSADVAARYGGEEFSLLLPSTTLSEARLISERIRERIENTDFPHRKVTVSIGVSAYSPLQSTPEEIIEAADKALYQAKRIGKNNVQLWLFGQRRK